VVHSAPPPFDAIAPPLQWLTMPRSAAFSLRTLERAGLGRCDDPLTAVDDATGEPRTLVLEEHHG
jgi:hypothetical protein